MRPPLAFSAAIVATAAAGVAHGGPITGTVFVDVDDDGLFSAADQPVAGVRVAFDTAAFAITGDDGAFYLDAPAGPGIVWVRTTDDFEPGPVWRAVETQPTAPIEIGLTRTAVSHPAVFVIASDSHLGRDEYGSAMADEFDGADLALGLTQATDVEPRPQFFVIVGDIVQSNEPWGYYDVLGVARDLGIPFVPVPGNHDWFDGGETYRSILGPPMYSFDSGGIRFVVLNDNGSVTAYSAFLAQDLADAGDRPVVAFMHRPPGDATLAALELAGVDYLLTGHWHSNERFSYGDLVEVSTEPIIRGGMDTTPAGYRIASLVDDQLVFAHGSVVDQPHFEVAYPQPGGCVSGDSLTVIATAMVGATRPTLLASVDGGPEVEMTHAGGWAATARLPLTAAPQHDVKVRLAGSTKTVSTYACGPQDARTVTDWPQLQGTARHEGAAPASFEPPLRVRWARAVGGHVHGGSPVVADGRVFVTVTDFGGPGGGAVVALDALTGETLWRFDEAGDMRSAPAVDKGVVVAASLDGAVFGLDAVTGQVLWSADIAAGLEQNVSALKAAPAIANGAVYIGTQARFVALDVTTGAELWQDVPTPDHATLTSYAAAGASDTLVAGAFGRGRGGVVGWDAMTGERIWTLTRTDSEGVHASPVVGDDAVYVENAKGQVMAYDPQTGERFWKTSLHEGATNWDYGLIATPALARDRLFVPGQYDHLFALDATTGQVLWTLSAEPSVLHVSHARTTASAFPSSPVITGMTLWIGGADARLRAVDTATGTPLWSTALDSPLTAGLAPAGDVLYAASFGGVVYALDEADPPNEPSAQADAGADPPPAPDDGGCGVAHSRGLPALALLALAALAWRRRR